MVSSVDNCVGLQLELGDNRLSGGFEHLVKLSSLTKLNLSGNKKISSADQLDALVSASTIV